MNILKKSPVFISAGNFKNVTVAGDCFAFQPFRTSDLPMIPYSVITG
jgi:hypothetical protein